MISGISKVEADYTCRDLDHCGYHKKPNSIIVLVYIVLWKYTKNYCVKCKYLFILFVLLKIQGQMDQAAASLETIQVLALLSKKCIRHVHCARYNLQIQFNSRLYSNHACPQNHVNSQNKEGALGQSECR